MNLAKIIDRIGDWNPQLLREVKGRFTSNGLTLIITSLLRSMLDRGRSLKHRRLYGFIYQLGIIFGYFIYLHVLRRSRSLS